MKFRLMLAAALLCVAVSPAHAKKFVPATPVAAELPVEIYLSQQEIGIDKPPTGNPNGLLGALVATAVDNVRAKRAEARVAQLRDWFLDYDFNKRFEDAIRAKLSANITPVPKYQVLDLELETEGAGIWMNDFAHPPENPPLGMVMKVRGKWAMSYTLQKLYVRTSVYLVDRTRAPNGKIKDKQLLSRAYTFEVALGRTWGIDDEINIRRWKVVGAPEMTRLLDLAVEQSTDMLAWDFSPKGREMLGERIGHRETSLFHGEKVDGRVFREDKDWYWAYVGIYDEPYMPRSIAGVYTLVAQERAPEESGQAGAAK